MAFKQPWPKARARKLPGVMNKLEQRYAQYLDLQLKAGEIQDWQYETITFKLGHDTRYTPDFPVIAKDDTLEFHETKGFKFAKNMQKLKIAASMFRFKFILVTEEKGQFILTEIPGSGGR